MTHELDAVILERLRRRRALEAGQPVRASEDALRALTAALANWAHEGGLAAFELYTLARATEWRVLPKAGGWLDQPAWWTRAVAKFLAMEEWLALNDALPDARGLPTLEALDG